MIKMQRIIQYGTMFLFLFAAIHTHNMDPRMYEELLQMGNAAEFRKKYGYKERRAKGRVERNPSFDYGRSVAASKRAGRVKVGQAYAQYSYSNPQKSFSQVSASLATN